MSNNKLSGAANKKRKKERLIQQNNLLEKVPKLENFFKLKVNNENFDDINVSEPVNIPASHTTPDPHPEISNEVSDDPAMWIVNDETIYVLLRRGIQQNIDADFSITKRDYSDRARYLTKSVFSRTLINGKTQARPWVVYSKSKLAIYCAACKLFGKTSSLTQGFNDWKNVYQRLKEHENSYDHKSANTVLLVRSRSSDKIDANLKKQVEDNVQYWRDVLKRVVEVVRSLAIRGLPFRGSNEKFGSLNNGNYLMTLELLAQFDPFLAEHIKTYGNKGKGSTSYMSSTICDEFIQLMGERVVKCILEEVKSAKYFSLIIDSTPDIAHIDQLSFVMRYVSDEGEPKERFLKFIANCGHKADELMVSVLETLDEYGLDIADCRGQSYDNASNMSGIYAGLQAKIKNINSLADYVPCSAHSLNLVGTCAAECAPKAVYFFASLQQLYTFFSASTHRWSIVKKHLEVGAAILKNLSVTRWSARHDACHSLSESWNQILSALLEISNDGTQKAITRSEAVGLHKAFNNLENCILTVFWNDVLHRFNAVSKVLQSETTDLSVIVELYEALIKFINNMRVEFDYYETKAIEKCGLDVYQVDYSRKRKRKTQFDESQKEDEEAILSGRDKFIIDTYYIIIDRLSTELKRRCAAYTVLYKRFGFLTSLSSLTAQEISDHTKKLCEFYPNDIEDTLDVECKHFKAHLESLGHKEISALLMCKILSDKDLVTIYPNLNIALRIFLCIPSTNCSAERSFSALRRIKSYLRSSISENRLNCLAVMNIEADLTKNLSFDKLVDNFADLKGRRAVLK